MQDVWIKVFKHAAKWDGDMAWVMAIAANTVLDWRKKRRLPTADADVIDLVDTRGPAAVEADPDLGRCLDDLSQQHERAYKLVIAFYHADTDDDALATELGVKPVSVRTGRSKALALLRECLENRRKR